MSFDRQSEIMQAIVCDGLTLHLLPQKAVYLPAFEALLVADVHIGKSETFQHFGIPIASTVNQTTLDCLSQLCAQFRPKQLLILGDLLHSRLALVDSALGPLQQFVATGEVDIKLIVGNHDRGLAASLESCGIACVAEVLELGRLVLSHEPLALGDRFNICGHVHPCLQLRTQLDRLRLPCFFLDKAANQLILPAFGEFTGGYEMTLQPQTVAYAIAEEAVVPFAGRSAA
ncbi:MAG: ligase-associated DNA damage response endonuclease PdeM [Leptolyngbya sp. SIO4C5]|nr:ligase-associated DNA damage response endonuclease PdeM [Leptolyngbya sp. SIO4C5]